MKTKLIIATALIFLSGCDPTVVAKYTKYMDWALSSIAAKQQQIDTLPEGDPRRIQLEAELKAQGDTIENFTRKALLDGLQIETDDFIIQARSTNSGSFKTIIIITEKPVLDLTPVAPDDENITGQSSASTRP